MRERQANSDSQLAATTAGKPLLSIESISTIASTRRKAICSKVEMWHFSLVSPHSVTVERILLSILDSDYDIYAPHLVQDIAWMDGWLSRKQFDDQFNKHV